MTRDEIIESEILDCSIKQIEKIEAEPPYEPTADEISSYISAWDGDISEEEARSLLKEAHRIFVLSCEGAKLPHTCKQAEPNQLPEIPETEEDADLFVDAVEAMLEGASAEPKQAEPPEPVRQNDGGEFTTLLRETISTLIGIYVPGAIKEDPQHILVSQICAKAKEACDRIDAQKQEIAELGADKVQLENDDCVAQGEIERLKSIIDFREKDAAIYRNKIAYMATENAKLAQDLQGTCEMMTANSKTIAALNEEIERLKDDAEGFVSTEHAVALSKEIDRLTARLKELEPKGIQE